MVHDDSLDLSGTALANKFLVRRRLGAGGMGAVYEAEHLITRRVGALKLLHGSVLGRPHIVQRFVQEASAAGRIGNPHIVETIDAGELPGGAPYMFMELLTGSSVAELVKRRGRLSFAEAREIVLQAAEGLEAAHAAGIVHRDVKPENLFVCRGEPPYVKLLDFGISKFEQLGDHRLTAEGAPLGTPYYMSPEQVAGKSDVGPSTDVYSLGVVLYECVTGQVPYDAGTLPALSLKIFEGSYAPPSSVLGAAAPGLDEVVARAMATSPSRRYASMAELRAALLALGPSSARSLSRTLDGAAALDVTAEAAPPSADLPVPGLTPSSPEPRRRYAAVWAAAAVALGVAGAVVLRRERPPEPPVPPAPRVETSAPVQVSAEAVPAPSPPVSIVPTASNTPAPQLQKAPRAAASARRSKAAQDGLSETNPFEN